VYFDDIIFFLCDSNQAYFAILKQRLQTDVFQRVSKIFLFYQTTNLEKATPRKEGELCTSSRKVIATGVMKKKRYLCFNRTFISYAIRHTIHGAKP